MTGWTYGECVRSRRRDDQAPTYSVTSARRGHARDQRSREVRYLLSMGIRLVCIVLAVVVSGPLRWVFVVGAIVLPYVAVLIANAGREAAGEAPVAPGTAAPIELEGSPKQSPPVTRH